MLAFWLDGSHLREVLALLCLLSVPIWIAIVLCLIADRAFKKKKAEGKCPNCSYDLTGTLKAGNITCPECGTIITTDPANLPHLP